jgi:hypothetical protein
LNLLKNVRMADSFTDGFQIQLGSLLENANRNSDGSRTLDIFALFEGLQGKLDYRVRRFIFAGHSALKLHAGLRVRRGSTSLTD